MTLLLHFLRARQTVRAAGIEEIGIVDPFQHTVDAETKLADGYTSRTLGTGRLGSIVLPGFWIVVAWLWQDVLPPTARCLREMLG